MPGSFGESWAAKFGAVARGRTTMGGYSIFAIIGVVVVIIVVLKVLGLV